MSEVEDIQRCEIDLRDRLNMTPTLAATAVRIVVVSLMRAGWRTGEDAAKPAEPAASLREAMAAAIYGCRPDQVNAGHLQVADRAIASMPRLSKESRHALAESICDHLVKWEDEARASRYPEHARYLAFCEARIAEAKAARAELERML